MAPEYPELTPYQFASNTPIMATDLDGLEAKIVIDETFSSDQNPAIRHARYETINVPEHFRFLGNGVLAIKRHTNYSIEPSVSDKGTVSPLMKCEGESCVATSEEEILRTYHNEEGDLEFAETETHNTTHVSEFSKFKSGIAPDVSKGGGVKLWKALSKFLKGGKYGTKSYRTTREVLTAQSKATKSLENISFLPRKFMSSNLTSLSKDAIKSHKKELTNVVEQLRNGNLNPGIGTVGPAHNGVKGVYGARHANGARVYFTQTADGKLGKIVGFANKNNQDKVLKELQSLYGKAGGK